MIWFGEGDFGTNWKTVSINIHSKSAFYLTLLSESGEKSNAIAIKKIRLDEGFCRQGSFLYPFFLK